jgi:hypothetical protein
MGEHGCAALVADCLRCLRAPAGVVARASHPHHGGGRVVAQPRRLFSAAALR